MVKERGYTLDGAKTALTEEHKLTDKVEIVFRLEAIKAELLQLKARFDELDD